MSALVTRIRARGYTVCQCHGWTPLAHPLRKYNLELLGGCGKNSKSGCANESPNYHTSERQMRLIHNVRDYRMLHCFYPSYPMRLGASPLSYESNCSTSHRWNIRHMSSDSDASSKVEETVRRLKEKHEDKLKQIQNIQDLDLRVKSVIELDQETDRAVQQIKQQAKAVKVKIFCTA